MLERVRFIRYGANTAIGGFAPGERWLCTHQMALHLIGCGVAVRVDADPNPPAQADQPATRQRAARRKRQSKE